MIPETDKQTLIKRIDELVLSVNQVIEKIDCLDPFLKIFEALTKSAKFDNKLLQEMMSEIKTLQEEATVMKQQIREFNKNYYKSASLFGDKRNLPELYKDMDEIDNELKLILQTQLKELQQNISQLAILDDLEVDLNDEDMKKIVENEKKLLDELVLILDSIQRSYAQIFDCQNTYVANNHQSFLQEVEEISTWLGKIQAIKQKHLVVKDQPDPNHLENVKQMWEILAEFAAKPKECNKIILTSEEQMRLHHYIDLAETSLEEQKNLDVVADEKGESPDQKVSLSKVESGDITSNLQPNETTVKKAIDQTNAIKQNMKNSNKCLIF